MNHSDMKKVNIFFLPAGFAAIILCMTLVRCKPSEAVVAGKTGDQKKKFRQIQVDPFSLGRLHCKTVADISGDGNPDIIVGDDAGRGVFWYKWPEWSKHQIDIGHYTSDPQSQIRNPKSIKLCHTKFNLTLEIK